MGRSSDWYLRVWGMQRRMSEADLFEDPDFRIAIVVVDDHMLHALQGMCFIYGTKPRGFHPIRQGHAIRFRPTKDQHVFAYQYDPVSFQLEYTPYRCSPA